MKLRLETGSSLTLILVFLALISWIGIHIESQNLLLYESMRHFSNEMKKEILAEKELAKNEDAKLALFQESSGEAHLSSEFNSGFSSEFLSELKNVIFLPDHLEWGCKTGFILLPVCSTSLQSNFMLRAS